MKNHEHQVDLFQQTNIPLSSTLPLNELVINSRLIEEWQNRINKHQSKLFKGSNLEEKQISLFYNPSEEIIKSFKPLELTPLPIIFWKWPTSSHKGPAIYIVMDSLKRKNENIILYIGETITADKRWKGNHDCKRYLSNYSESLQKACLAPNLNIRFWMDVPSETKARRMLEQKLIQAWLPPFNKETRTRWKTPFTSEL